MRLTAAKRAAMPKKDFAGGGPKGAKSFPMNDAVHARMAISGATRSERAGNISPAKEASIKARARKKLGDTTHPQSHAAFERLGR
ncbi:MAG: hypothetical protein KGL39_31035 [Patescibacteria group bacterium]|nr:hypothetical protein [Patescibacteria group bacterium]